MTLRHRLIFVLLLTSLLTASCDVDSIWKMGIERGKVDDVGMYRNISLNMESKFPTGWAPISDSLLDWIEAEAAQLRKDGDPNPYPLAVSVNPNNGSLYGIECWPLSSQRGSKTLQDIERQMVLDVSQRLTAAGWSDRQIVSSHETVGEWPSVKFVVDTSTAQQTAITIEYMYIYTIHSGSPPIIVRHSAFLADSQEVAVIDRVVKTTRHMR